MPIKSGGSKKIISGNIAELIKSKMSAPRAKGVNTMAKRLGITKKAAEVKQAVAIAYSKAGKARKKTH